MEGGCLAELRIQLGTVFITLISMSTQNQSSKLSGFHNTVIQNGTELLLVMTSKPMKFCNCCKSSRKFTETVNILKFKRKDINTPTKEEILEESRQEYKLPTYPGTLYDYDELIIQFGYVTLFIVVFPLVPLLALVTNIVEVKSDYENF